MTWTKAAELMWWWLALESVLAFAFAHSLEIVKRIAETIVQRHKLIRTVTRVKFMVSFLAVLVVQASASRRQAALNQVAFLVILIEQLSALFLSRRAACHLPSPSFTSL